MYVCADLSKKHEKQVHIYLDEFYRVHSELAGRAFDFIKSHDLLDEFHDEKDGAESKRESEPPLTNL